jgi:2,3-bisphosphoglycerate-independent phosphoglycerate mutase
LGAKYLEMMKRSYELLKDHPINVARKKAGKNPANSLWFWGEGTKPSLQNFYDRFGLKGGIISAVDLLKGIGKLAGMEVIEVEGATGNYDTNFSGKATACLDALERGLDFVYLHMEAPDECGHHGDAKNKIFSIEQIDELVVKPIFDTLTAKGEPFKLLICPDHPTPLSIMTHCKEPVPYLIYNSEQKVNGAKAYDEEQAEKTGVFIENGVMLMQRLLDKKD